MLEKIRSWEVLRSFGELQILTRASYLAIILIPIISGLWPSVRVAINHYNKVAIAASNHLDSASATLSENVERLSQLDVIKVGTNENTALEVEGALSGIGSAAKKLIERVEEFRQKFDPKQLDMPTLPLVWFFAFIGSVFVILGHVIYQSGVPDIVKQNTKIEYLLAKRKLALESGNNHKYDIKNIETKAIEEYERASASGLGFLKTCVLTLYSLGVICIIVVLGFQIIAVLKASGIVAT